MGLRNTTLTVCLLAFICACSQDDGPARPNVLFVTLDTTRADFLSCYGSDMATTPVFDGLAAEGVRFNNANSSSAVTPVSHATILTGKFQHNHGLRVISGAGGAHLDRNEWYLPATLKQVGYSTAAVHSAFPVSESFGFERAFDEFHDFDAEMTEGKRAGGTVWDMGDYQRRSDETTDIAIEVSDGLAEPFFMWVHYWDPHDEIRIPAEAYLNARGVPEHKKLRKADEMYAAEVGYMDREFGRLINHLKTTERYENTIVVVTADHGEGLSDGADYHGWDGHRMLYREQVHVPLIFRFPADVEVPIKRVVNQLVRTADIVPTLLEYLNLPATDEFDGRTLSSLIRAEPDEPRIAFYDQINGYDLNAHLVERRPDSAFLYTVNDGKWKLTYRPHMPEESELFEYAGDRRERKNLYTKRPNQVRRLLILLAREQPWVTEPFSGDDGIDPSSAEALGALGYSESVASLVSWAWTCPNHQLLYFEERDLCSECNEFPIPIPAR